MLKEREAIVSRGSRGQGSQEGQREEKKEKLADTDVTQTGPAYTALLWKLE